MGARGSSERSSGSSVSLDEATSSSNASSFVDPMQQQFLQGLFNDASQFSSATKGRQAREVSRDASSTLMPQIGGALSNIGMLTDPTAQIAEQSASLQSGLGALFRNEINPAIQTDAIAAGGLGGGRQGVAEGVATGQLADAYTQGYGDIVARANTTANQAASLVPGLSQAYYSTALAPTTAAFGPLAQFADILGAPTVLDESRSRSQAVGQARSSTNSNSGSFGFSII